MEISRFDGWGRLGGVDVIMGGLFFATVGGLTAGKDSESVL